MASGGRRWITVAALAWAACVAVWLARGYFVLPLDMLPGNHERHHYVYRLLEFRDLLGAGYWSPQWATHFRAGLGSPYFSYYQPGFFYLASLVPWFVEPTRALGVTVVAASIVGFAAAFFFIRSRFGPLPALIGAAAFQVAPYTRSEVLVRGDLSELAGMMLVPFALHRFLDALERGRGRDLAGVAVAVAGMIVLHPCVGLLGVMALGAALVVFAVLRREWARDLCLGAAIAVGVGLAGFYVLPVMCEMDLVSWELGFRGPYQYWVNFVALADALSGSVVDPIPVSMGVLLPVLVVFNVAMLLGRWRSWAPAERRFLGLMLLVAGCMLFLVTPSSQPVWELLPPLQKLQFPGRTFSILTPALACAAGAMGGRMLAGWRGAGVGLVAGVLMLQSLAEMRPRPPITFTHVTGAGDLVTTAYFKPDLANEWLPRGASAFGIRGAPRQPVLSWGTCDVSDFRREQGRLSLRVAPTTGGCRITLPHLYFPVGWRVTIAGAAGGTTYERAKFGLMQIGVPPGPGGEVEVTFAMTPMRRLGWGVTLLSAVSGLGLLLARRDLS